MPPRDLVSEVAPRAAIGRRAFVKSAACLLGVGGFAPSRAARAQEPPPRPIRVRIWCEGTAPKGIYPRDVDGALGDDLRTRPGFEVAQARLGEADAGLSDRALDATDSLVWWGRLRHDDVPEDRVREIVDRVRAGRLGLVALHGSYASKPFRALLGQACAPRAWREDGRPERLKVERPDHPIARGVQPFTIPKTSMFAEPFAVPEPEAVVLTSTWDGGEVFRSGLTWKVDQGRIAYFRPGHDGFPVLFHPGVRQVIANAAVWAGRPAAHG